MNVRLNVDGEEITLNKFVVNVLSGSISGAISSLKGINENWKEIEIKVER
ncbi:hypothetical protein [[Eubacterium] cellulosolvens]